MVQELKRRKKKSKIGKKIFLSLMSLFLVGVIFLFLTPWGIQLRITAAEMILSSQHRYLAKYTLLPKEKLDQIEHNINNPKYENTLPISTPSPTQTPTENVLKVTVQSIENDGVNFYKGQLLTVSNPKNVRLLSSKLDNYGEQINVQAERAGAIAATNASGFVDKNGVGNGGELLGIAIMDGVIQNQDPNQKGFVGAIKEDGTFFSGYYSGNELVDLDVKYAAGFKPQLIVNGKKMITEGNGGWGYGPRTAMGQKADGTILILVIDGRQPTRSIGASQKDVQDILFEHGAVNAIAMDGGSSSSMYFNHETITIPSAKNNINRYLPNIWAIIPDKGQKVEITRDGEKVTFTP